MRYNDTEKEWEHADDCLSRYPLPTQGNWHCTCGYDAYAMIKEDAEDYEAELLKLRPEVEQLRKRLLELAPLFGIWDTMSDFDIAFITFDYGGAMIGAFDFEGELAAEAETLDGLLAMLKDRPQASAANKLT